MKTPMTKSKREGPRTIGPIVTSILVAGIGGWVVGGMVPPPSRADAARHAAVPADLVGQVTAVTRPVRPTMSDEIEHFEARAAARPDEAFSQTRLFQANMLAFRAYGAPSHLEAAAVAAQHLGSGTDDAVSLDARASLHLSRHEFGDALQTARALARLRSTDAVAYRLFDALWATGARDEARALLDGPLDTLSTAWLSRSARVLDADGLVTHARDRFRQVVEYTLAYAEPAPVRAWSLVELGHFELHSGEPGEAVRRYREALEVLPASPAALEGLASVAWGVDRDLETAARLYRHAIENGAHLDVIPRLADIEEERGRVQAAADLREDFVTRATADETSLRMYRRPLIFLLAEKPETRRDALALARTDLAERHDPGAWDALAWVQYGLGDIDSAWRSAARAIADGSPPPPIALRAGLIAAAANHHREARRLLDAALSGRIELSGPEVTVAEGALAQLGGRQAATAFRS